MAAAENQKSNYFFDMDGYLTFLFLLSPLIQGNAQRPAEYPYRLCSNATFTPNGTYQSSLDLLFSALASNTPGVGGFYNASAGRPPNDTAHGLFQCRGDVNEGSCQNCVFEAVRDVRAGRYCPLRREAVIWYNDYELRFSDRYFFGAVARQPRLRLINSADIQVDVDRFKQLVLMTLRGTVARVASASSEGKIYATNEANFTANRTIYALSQCTGDLSNLNCGECLSDAVKEISNCCSGKQGARVLFPSCYVRYEIYEFYYNPTGTPIPSPATPPPPSPPSGRSSTVIVVAIVVPIAVFVLLFVVGWYFLRRRTKKKRAAGKKDSVADEMATVESLQFDFNTIDAATNQFSAENKLGEGGFGEVYKGRLDNGQEIAVKRLSRGSLQGSDEFKNEVLLVAKLQHRNLVTLLGFCLEGEEKMLIYEYIPNKSLDYFLYDPERQRELDWSTRYKIINGIARGILYLHEDSRLRVIHRDLKPSNILLDGDMNPKISDFGMARIIQANQTQGNTNRIVGTYGYMSPEYAMRGHFSMKSDVYSFGVLVLEIMSGKKNSAFHLFALDEDILNYTWKLWNDGTPLELLDPNLGDSYLRSEVLRCIHIGLLCVQEDPTSRPSMASIVLMLNRYSVTLPLPTQPAFCFRNKDSDKMMGLESSQSENRLMSWSVNEISTTELYPR